MSAPYVCTSRRSEMASATTHMVNENAAILCVSCAEDPAITPVCIRIARQ